MPNASLVSSDEILAAELCAGESSVQSNKADTASGKAIAGEKAIWQVFMKYAPPLGKLFAS